MMYLDLEKIYREQGVPNKYMLALIVSARARQLSDQKGRLTAEEGAEKFISRALREISSGLINFSFQEIVANNTDAKMEK